MPFYTDTHAHVYLPEFKDDLELIVQRAKDAYVMVILLPNIDSSTTADLKATCDSDMIFRPMMGLHPCSVKANYKDELAKVKSELDSGYTSQHGRKYIAVGEIGIDLHWDKSTLGIQVEAFEQQMLWANEMNLPVAVHCRNAYDEVIASISNMGDRRPKGVLHCFTGNLAQAEELIDLGLMLGIGGVITYKNSGLAEVVAHIDIRHLILETDSPYLTPVPFRGKRNEPAYIPYIAQKLAEAKNISDIDRELMQPIMENVAMLFNLRK